MLAGWPTPLLLASDGSCSPSPSSAPEPPSRPPSYPSSSLSWISDASWDPSPFHPLFLLSLIRLQEILLGLIVGQYLHFLPLVRDSVCKPACRLLLDFLSMALLRVLLHAV
eukprot:gnl/TRDRNA2_/TRDRNA2_169516_c2_seq6.p2 gnl/TRDRNA2_/TRDRNA2_169516_c2~~gnl/TRDRNA2_/TRDRNA2_169516_c2_seq6.p2  ORF type:complete len:111 (-),score=5.97 gnl/TRDRNA2_/TRDRNA2_169516_c2_seq6:242-574(-)